jgi:hypothetical protein
VEWVSYFRGTHAISQRQRGRSRFFAPTRGRVVARFLISLASPTQRGVGSFAFLAKGPQRHTQRVLCRTGKKLRRQRRYLPRSTSSGQALAKNARTGHLEPNFRPPFECITAPPVAIEAGRGG